MKARQFRSFLWLPERFSGRTTLAASFMRGWLAGLVLILAGPVWAAEPIVSDGDTLTVSGTKFRLDGIDAPEFNQICLNEKGQEWKVRSRGA
jgi:endonuclease YncB( thermonuclease family)